MHVLLISRKDGFTHMMCECGRYFGGYDDFLLERWAGDIIDAHREHAVHALVDQEEKFCVPLSVAPSPRLIDELQAEDLYNYVAAKIAELNGEAAP